MPDHLNVAAVAITNVKGQIFLVRKRGTTRWMQPGGKLEAGEAPLAAALREVAEELGVSWGPERLCAAGTWHGAAANEAGTTVTAHLFDAAWDPVHDGVARVGAELAEGEWMDPLVALRRDDLAPLLSDRVLPHVAAIQAATPPR